MISLAGRRALLSAPSRGSMAKRILPAQPAAVSPAWQAGARRALFITPTPIVRAANPQSGKPASDNMGHMMHNIKEESKGVRSSIESAVAGTDSAETKEDPKTGQTKELLDDAVRRCESALLKRDAMANVGLLAAAQKSIVGEMMVRVPRPAMLWGAAGIVPYVSTAGASIYLARQTQLVAQGKYIFVFSKHSALHSLTPVQASNRTSTLRPLRRCCSTQKMCRSRLVLYCSPSWAPSIGASSSASMAANWATDATSWACCRSHVPGLRLCLRPRWRSSVSGPASC